jgi:hypothetical protein
MFIEVNEFLVCNNVSLPDRSKKGSGCKIMPKKKKKRERRRNCASSRWRKKNEKHDWDAEQ